MSTLSNETPRDVIKDPREYADPNCSICGGTGVISRGCWCNCVYENFDAQRSSLAYTANADLGASCCRREVASTDGRERSCAATKTAAAEGSTRPVCPAHAVVARDAVARNGVPTIERPLPDVPCHVRLIPASVATYVCSDGGHRRGTVNGARGRRDVIAPRILTLLAASRRRVIPLCLGREPAAVPDAKRERLVPRDTAHRQAVVFRRCSRPRCAPIAVQSRAERRCIFWQKCRPSSVPAYGARTTDPGTGRRRVLLRPVSCVYERTKSPNRHFVAIEEERRHRRRIARVVTPIERPSRDRKRIAARPPRRAGLAGRSVGRGAKLIYVAERRWKICAAISTREQPWRRPLNALAAGVTRPLRADKCAVTVVPAKVLPVVKSRVVAGRQDEKRKRGQTFHIDYCTTFAVVQP